MRAGIVLLLLAGFSGCAYYNGVYNTKKLARSAERAERDGRTLEANGLWGQVAVRAESTLVRHPRSKWTDETRFLQGRALSRTHDCGRAVAPLELVMLNSPKTELVEAAASLLGACKMSLGDPSGANVAYARLTSSSNPDRRNLALYQHGRALRLAGRYTEALAELRQSSYPLAFGERAAAHAGAGQVDSALALSDSLLAVGDTTAPWDSLLVSLGRVDPAAATALTDRLVAMPSATPEMRARWLNLDAGLALRTDTARAFERLDQAQRVGPGIRSATLAHYQDVRLRIRRAGSADELRTLQTELAALSQVEGPAANDAAQRLSSLQQVFLVSDSVVPETEQGDLRLFLAAELARDSVGAQGYAVTLFRRVSLEWPQSPFAPKALLAQARIDPVGADSIWSLLNGRYEASPYLAALRGENPPEYRQLEDSLRTFALSGRRSVATPTRSNPARPQPTTHAPVPQ